MCRGRMPAGAPRVDLVRVLLVNLPGRVRLMRRYVAAYHAPNLRLPPLELMGLGAVARQRPGTRVQLLDCVAADLDLVPAVRRAQRFRPDVVVTLLGFEVCGEDLDALAVLRRALHPARVLAFGYLASALPERVLAQDACDAVLVGEPEHTFAEVLDRLARGGDLEGIAGLVRRIDGGVEHGPARDRIRDLDALPWPDHSLVDAGAYRESFMPRPIGAIMSARGCPHRCTFCVRTFGRELVLRSAESVAAEVTSLAGMGIRHVRFMDDTFTVRRDRTLEICDRLGRHKGLTWTALTRLPGLDDEQLRAMARAGCRRLYVGLESGSQRILDLYRKGLTVEQIREVVPRIQAAGIEVSAFFIVGAPGETESDVEASLQLALELEPDYVIVTRLQYWPGTELHETHRERLTFSLNPTRCEPLPEAGIPSHADYLRWERTFYRRFYLRPGYMARRGATLARSPADIAEGLWRLGSWVGGAGGQRDFI